jgi:hypothetical protein
MSKEVEKPSLFLQIEVPEKYVPFLVAKIQSLRENQADDLDGIDDVNLMAKMEYSVEKYVAADRVFENFMDRISEYENYVLQIGSKVIPEKWQKKRAKEKGLKLLWK